QAHILIVDDEPGIRFFLEEMLARDGHRVSTAPSGEEALARIPKDDFDLVLLDLRMQGVSGLDVLDVLHQRSPDTPVIVLTGHATLETAVEALRHGAHDYLFKPCKTIALRESVRTALLKREQTLVQRKQQQALQAQIHRAFTFEDEDSVPPAAQPYGSPERFLQRGRLIVDIMRHVITLDGKLLELSPTEFDLLAYMASEAPRVVPPRELVREVQGYESDLQEARDVVRYHVYRIRRKVKDATGCDDVIRTVRGVGYTLGMEL
ncbi:MAG: response regulator transcription factor, partial [Anaerolineae bacterium]|nr:response regulator transcription factor [Anaerolineae bacterium]